MDFRSERISRIGDAESGADMNNTSVLSINNSDEVDQLKLKRVKLDSYCSDEIIFTHSDRQK